MPPDTRAVSLLHLAAVLESWVSESQYCELGE